MTGGGKVRSMQRSCGIDTMIPGWSTNGDLPPGVQFAIWQELEDSAHLQSAASSDAGRIPPGLQGVAESRCRLVYLDGSFVTRKEHPGDFDACWDIQNVDDAKLDPVFWDFSRVRAAQKQRFLGELFPAQLPEGATGRAFVDFFQVNR